MTTSYSTNLGLALPVQGELSGTWGDMVNNGITQYSDIAIAGTQTISGSQTAVTLSLTNGTSSATNIAQVASGATGSAQYAIINCTGNPAGLLTVTVPASSRQYIVINATSTSQSVKIVGSGPTTGVTILSGEKAIVVWNGTDYVKTASSLVSQLSGTLGVANGGTGNTTIAAKSIFVANTLDTLTTVTPSAGQSVRINAGGTAWEAFTPSSADVTAAGNNAFTGANTFYNATGQTFGTGTAAQDGIVLTGRAGGTSTYRVTLTPATLSSSTTLTLPNVTSTVAVLGTTQTYTAAQTFRAASAVRSEAAATQDAVVLAGRAGGTGSYAVSLTPTTLSANRTLTLPDASTTVVGTDTTQTLTNKTLTNPTVTNYVETPVTANTGTTYTIDITNGTLQILTLTGNCTFTFPTATSGKSFMLLLKQDATGSRTVTWPSVTNPVKWPGGTAPTITATASKMDKYVFTADGTNWYGSTAGQNY